jgi:hypothetical protein
MSKAEDCGLTELRDGLRHLYKYIDGQEVFTITQFSKLYTLCYDACIEERVDAVADVYKTIVTEFCGELKSNTLSVFIETLVKFRTFNKWLTRIFMYLMRIKKAGTTGFADTVFYEKNFLPNCKALNKEAFSCIFQDENTRNFQGLQEFIKLDMVNFHQDIYIHWEGMAHHYTSENSRQNMSLPDYFKTFKTEYHKLEGVPIELSSMLQEVWLQNYVIRKIGRFYDYFSENLDLTFMSELYAIVSHATSKSSIVSKLAEIYVSYIDMSSNLTIDAAIELLPEKKKEISQHFSNEVIFGKKLCDKLGSWLNDEKETRVDLLMTILHKAILNKDHTQITALNGLLPLIKSQDVTESLYRKRLSQRLTRRNPTIELELKVLEQIETNLGFYFTNKSATMLKDVMKKELPPIQEIFRCKVLQHGAWPFKQSFQCKLPEKLATMETQFETLYKSSNPNRRLAWHRGKGEVRICYNKRYQLIMAPVQAAVISWLSELSYAPTAKELSEIMCMKQMEVNAILQSLQDTGVCLLNVDKDGRYSLKPSIESSNICIRYKMPQPRAKKTKALQAECQYDRKYCLDAAIVRVMKSEKNASHSQLISRTMQEVVTFKPTAQDIKKRIESLIDRDYMERNDAGDGYNYVA